MVSSIRHAEARLGWTVRDIPDQSGRRFMITGANSGLGAVAAEALADAGAHVTLACRDVGKGAVVASRIGARAQVRRLDLADLSSLREFANGIESFDVLINNAGLMAVPESRTADGFELQFGTNHLGHFALTGLLLDRITDRVVTVSSIAHRMGSIRLDDLNWDRRRYRRWSAYGQSKLANMMFAYELSRRLQDSGSSVKSVAAHPGYASTGLQSHTGTSWDRVMRTGNRLAQSAEMGALPELFAATADGVEPGSFVGPGGPFGIHGHPRVVRSNRRSHDRATAAALWKRSEQLTGVAYAFGGDRDAAAGR